MVEETPVVPPKKLSGGVLALVIIGVLILCACLAVFAVPAILALLGPSVGTVFSNIIETLGTPTP